MLISYLLVSRLFVNCVSMQSLESCKSIQGIAGIVGHMCKLADKRNGNSKLQQKGATHFVLL